MKLSVGIAAVAMLANVSVAQAVSLGDLAGGGSIQVFDKLFDNWVVEVNSITGNDFLARSSFNLNNIDITGDASRGALDPGLVFTPSANELTIAQSGGLPVNAQLLFRFDVTVLDSHYYWKDNELSFAITETVGGLEANRSAHIHEMLFTDSSLTTQFAEKDVHRTNDEGAPLDLTKLIDSATFPLRKSGTVLKDITMEVHSNGEAIGITQFDQHFSQVPEPGTIGVMSLALASLTVVGWRRAPKALRSAANA